MTDFSIPVEMVVDFLFISVVINLNFQVENNTQYLYESINMQIYFVEIKLRSIRKRETFYLKLLF